ncbi:hypothetical protein [Rhodanobacter sp. B04]|uniref:hypothetical protein n=1 Tax=Rhodanobacter sp. B04 TaxID=1945860 RepID=UPI001115A84B|nr:hypothetical protein [Rhodanobacter sp. B04]
MMRKILRIMISASHAPRFFATQKVSNFNLPGSKPLMNPGKPQRPLRSFVPAAFLELPAKSSKAGQCPPISEPTVAQVGIRDAKTSNSVPAWSTHDQPISNMYAKELATISSHMRKISPRAAPRDVRKFPGQAALRSAFPLPVRS